MSKPRGTNETGVAGVFAVCAHLASLGWYAATTLGNTPRTDVLAQVGEDLLPAAVQVKTKSAHAKDFQPKVTGYSKEWANEWAVLVALSDDGAPDFYVMPRDHLVACVRAFENAIGGRIFLGAQEFDSSYMNKWGLMEQPSWHIDWDLLPDWVKEAADGETWAPERGPFPL